MTVTPVPGPGDSSEDPRLESLQRDGWRQDSWRQGNERRGRGQTLPPNGADRGLTGGSRESEAEGIDGTRSGGGGDATGAGQSRAPVRARGPGTTGRHRLGQLSGRQWQAAQCAPAPVRRRRLGRFRLLRRWRGRRGADPQSRQAGTTGQAPDVLLFGTVLHPVTRFDHDGAPADAPWPVAAPDVRAAWRA